MLEGVLRLGDRRVSGLITPRIEVSWLDLEDSIDVNLRKLLDSRYSHLPAGDGSLDDIQGIIDVRQVLAAIVAGSSPVAELDLTEFLLSPVFVPEYLPALQALEVFRSSKTALLLVIDEFGGFQGVVTVGDLLESIVGDMPTAGANTDSDVVVRDDGSMLIDGMYAIDELMELCDLQEPPGADQGLFETVGGFVMHHLGRIPAPGDRFEWNGWRFEVVDMDGLRVDKVLALRAPQGDSGQDS
jgi:putative hemolysin